METEEACRKTATGSLRLTKYLEERRCNSVARHLWWDGQAKDWMPLEIPAEEVGLVLSTIIISTLTPPPKQ